MANTATRFSRTIYQLRDAFALSLPTLTTISGPVFEKISESKGRKSVRGGNSSKYCTREEAVDKVQELLRISRGREVIAYLALRVASGG